MQEGWECHKCHNVYAPNVPFCLYCWFQNQTNSQTEIETKPTKSQNIISIPASQTTSIGKQEQQITIESNTNDILSNKNLALERVDIKIPTLDKQPIYPIPERYPDTKIFLGGIGHAKERAINRTFKIPYILDSIVDFPAQPSKLVYQYFDYIKKNNIEHMLDSGAFTYMKNTKKSFNLAAHLKQYCFYINEFDLTNFIELDLDVFMPLEEVENVRKKIYLETHKQPIIVFHTERGKDYWTNMCKENSFIAIGGLVTGDNWNSIDGQKILSDMCDEAHTYNTKVHGLGFTPLTLLNSHTMFFDTVDSTTWNQTKQGKSAALDNQGNLIKVPLIQAFSTIDSQEEDLRVWAEFAENYKGGIRFNGK